MIKDSKLDASDYCDVGLGCGTSNNPLLNWNITLPNVPKPPVIPPTPPQVIINNFYLFINSKLKSPLSLVLQPFEYFI